MTRRTLAAPLTWTPSLLHQHLQGAMDLELWTIPYYLTVLYSIKDISCAPYRLIQSAVYQEMLHAQLVSNIANAYGYSPVLTAPIYQGKAVPHLDFDLDTPNPTEVFTPYSAELGALDPSRINTMCLIEYPEWLTEREPDPSDTQQEYGSISEFYAALRVGMTELRDHVQGGRRQMDEFGPFYQGAGSLAVSDYGDAGFRQAIRLIDIIVDQGEGQTEPIETVPAPYQNTADGFRNAWPHFQKFDYIRQLPRWPNVYSGEAQPAAGTAGDAAQQVLIADFAMFLDTLNRIFRGEQTPPAFGMQMAKLGGDVLSCWQHNAIPRFS
ncbi:ferritin-like domain-containing protein [Xanthomonas graminis]|uniref:ferritin-like domain-containing protein n=1 Tax=Xanthomonas graminis TaxID=3390026 RepID=UPI001F3DCBAD|nr:ferritin-like protein [Xanthomonas translucens]UKE74787.1 ferritin-like protein [Xanthomonas translucens pv. phleipratensis]